ncbi:MAG: GNAT family N-acetyltransferase [Deltaproteobacteria bacterium]|nr:GNAT family N-acetyltransferase [Deltaproteobacteria bacterium]
MIIEIREATQADLLSVLSLYAQPEIDDGQILPLEQAQEIFTKIKTYPDYRIYVASAESKVVGTFSLLIMENLAHLGARSGVIEDVVVSPNFQRKGVGTRMVKFAIEICRHKGCYKLALSSNMKRKSAHEFYESLGFRRHGYSFLLGLNT